MFRQSRCPAIRAFCKESFHCIVLFDYIILTDLRLRMMSQFVKIEDLVFRSHTRQAFLGEQPTIHYKLYTPLLIRTVDPLLQHFCCTIFPKLKHNQKFNVIVI